jgi:regulator of protease activity HflC (stomatin/prohibitin superfamily)
MVPVRGMMEESMRVRSLGTAIVVVACCMFSAGCSNDIAPAHRGMMFDRTGPWALYTGGNGLVGGALDPGTYFTGIYDKIRVVDCSQNTESETLTSLTSDGVQFGLDVRIEYSFDCSDNNLKILLMTLTPGADGIIAPHDGYLKFIRPTIGEAVREAISPHQANDINRLREKILPSIRESFSRGMSRGRRALMDIGNVALNNMDFPDEMDRANVARAEQAILMERAVAERERLLAETETAKMRTERDRNEGLAAAAKIDAIGEALRRNPEYLQYNLQQLMPEIYEKAGAHGNLIITAPDPNVLLSPASPSKSGQ